MHNVGEIWTTSLSRLLILPSRLTTWISLQTRENENKQIIKGVYLSIGVLRFIQRTRSVTQLTSQGLM